MKNFVFGLLVLTLLTISCKKDNTPVENPDSLEMTFTGTVTNQLTQQPLANVPVHVIYGPGCCGAIAELKGNDSTVTNSQGVYTIQVKYAKPAAAYRHFAYVPGYFSVNFFNLEAYKKNTGWMTLGHNMGAFLPYDLIDTIKMINGFVSTATLKIVPAGTIALHFPYASIPATDSLSIQTIYSPDYDTLPTLSVTANYKPNVSLDIYHALLDIGCLANTKIFLKTFVYQAGTGILQQTVLDSITLVQGQVYDYNVEY